jgi:trafficking protein particle complex subunit 6
MSFEQPLPPFNASDPNASFLSTSCLDFLLIELVPMAYRITNELSGPADGGGPSQQGGGAVGSAPAAQKNGETGSVSHASTAAPTATGTAGTGSRRLDEEEERDAAFYRLETLGYRVGLGLVER